MKFRLWLYKKIFGTTCLDAYIKGVKDGVNQQYYEPESAKWMIREEYE